MLNIFDISVGWSKKCSEKLSVVKPNHTHCYITDSVTNVQYSPSAYVVRSNRAKCFFRIIARFQFSWNALRSSEIGCSLFVSYSCNSQAEVLEIGIRRKSLLSCHHAIKLKQEICEPMPACNTPALLSI